MGTGANRRLNAAMGILLPDDPATGDGGPGGPGGPPAPKPAPPANPAPAPQFTQEQVNAFTTEARDKGKRQAIKELSEQFGMTVEEAAELIKAHKETEDAKLSEAERAKREADEAKAQAEADREAAKRERHEAKVERALARAGVSDKPGKDGAPSPAQRAIRLLDLEVGADADAIGKGIEQLRTDFPGLFGTQSAPAPASDPGRAPGKQREGGTQFGAKGLEEAKRRGLIKDPATVG